MSSIQAAVIPVKPTLASPHIAAARVVPSGTLSNVFASAGTGTVTPADRAFSGVQSDAKLVADAVRADNTSKVAAHERYRDVEAEVVSQYDAKGISTAAVLKGDWEGIVSLHSKVTAIHEVAEEGKQNLQDIGDKAVADFGAKMDRLIARL